MIVIKVDQLAEIVQGEPLSTGNPCEITHICIDSRKVQKGSLYIPIKGERFDGHDFIKQAFENGAVAVFTEVKDIVLNGKWVIYVDNIRSSIYTLTKYYKKKFDIPFIALTGSSGKTTTKDITYAVLNQKYNVLKTIGNQNNDLGVPLTIFQLKKEHEMAIIEMGMDHAGEISLLVEMVEPNIAIITNIGLTHIENLKTQENIFKAKKEIFERLKQNDIALVNGDDNYLKGIYSNDYNVFKYGIHGHDVDIRAVNINSSDSGIEFDVLFKEEMHHYYFPLPGIHNVYNCLCAIYLGYLYHLTPVQIQTGLNSYVPSDDRMDIKVVRDILLINDCYNANPDAMKATLQVLIQYKKEGRAVAVLGDMLEMGKDSSRYHYEIGEYIAQIKNIEFLVAIGNDAKYYIEGAIASGFCETNCRYFKNNAKAVEFLLNNINKGDCYLIKGSRGMKMEEIVTALERS